MNKPFRTLVDNEYQRQSYGAMRVREDLMRTRANSANRAAWVFVLLFVAAVLCISIGLTIILNYS